MISPRSSRAGKNLLGGRSPLMEVIPTDGRRREDSPRGCCERSSAEKNRQATGDVASKNS